MGVLRWQRFLDFLTGRYLTKVAKNLDVEVRIALRLGSTSSGFWSGCPLMPQFTNPSNL